MTSLPDWGQLAIAVAALLVALGTIYRYIWPALKAVGRGVMGLIRLYQGTTQFISEWSGAGGLSVPARIQRIEKELHPNSGSTLRDAVDRAAQEAREAAGHARVAVTEANRLGAITHELRDYAQSNRDGIADLRDQVNDVSRRVTDIDGKVADQGAQILNHRQRNEAQVEELRRYLTEERLELFEAKQGLEASVAELLMVDAHEPREHAHQIPPDGPNTTGPIPPPP